MSHIGQNIRKIRKVRKISQAEFAALFNLARPSVGAYEEGRAEPRIDTVIQIAKHFGLSIDLLLTRELTVNDLFHLQSFKKKLDKVHKKGSAGVLLSQDSEIPVVYIDQQVEYIVNHDRNDFISGLPSVSWPGSGKGKYRVFEMEGSEMEYHRHGIKHGDLLLCRETNDPEPDKICVIVTSEAIIIKRLKKVAKTQLTCSSDNPIYQDMKINQKKILEVWEVTGFFSNQTSPPLNLEEKVLLMEEQLKKISSRLGSN